MARKIALHFQWSGERLATDVRQLAEEYHNAKGDPMAKVETRDGRTFRYWLKEYDATSGVFGMGSRIFGAWRWTPENDPENA